MRGAVMFKQADAPYFAGRAATERALSEAATDKRVAAIHAELADRYDELALGLSAGTILPFRTPAEARQVSTG